MKDPFPWKSKRHECIFLHYTIQHKPWQNQKDHSVLRGPLPEQPNINFRKAKCVKNLIAPSQLRPLSSSYPDSRLTRFLSITSTYRCNKQNYKTCSHIKHGQKSFLCPDGQVYTTKEFISCSTSYVVHGPTYPCGKLYVGRTICSLRERFRENCINV